MTLSQILIVLVLVPLVVMGAACILYVVFCFYSSMNRDRSNVKRQESAIFVKLDKGPIFLRAVIQIALMVFCPVSAAYVFYLVIQAEEEPWVLVLLVVISLAMFPLVFSQRKIAFLSLALKSDITLMFTKDGIWDKRVSRELVPWHDLDWKIVPASRWANGFKLNIRNPEKYGVYENSKTLWDKFWDHFIQRNCVDFTGARIAAEEVAEFIQQYNKPIA